MKKYFQALLNLTPTNINTNDMKDFNGLVLQVDSDDSKTLTKHNNRFKIFLLLFLKTKLFRFTNFLCNCPPFKSRKQDLFSEEEYKDISSLPSDIINEKGLIPLSIEHKGRKTLVLDLDETLVHSYFTPMQSDLYLEIPYQNKKLSFYINIRAGVEHFLEVLSEYYEIVIYTASMREYADSVITHIDKGKKISHRLFRDNCTLQQRGFVKDLSKLNRDLKDTIIIDNCSFSFAFQPDNGIEIKGFFNDPNDKELFELIPFLIFLSKVHDVRPISQWKEKFLASNITPFLDMSNQIQSFDKSEVFTKKKKPLLNIKEAKKRLKSKKKISDEEREGFYHGNGTPDSSLKKLNNRKYEKEEIEISEFDENRYKIDMENVNSPVLKVEIYEI